MDEINYDEIDSNAKETIRGVEAKPHVRYIRYLLSKRYSPRAIKKELSRLGLSAPHEPVLIKYYLEIMDPLIKKHKLGELYADYKNKILCNKDKLRDFSRNLLSYKLYLSDKPDMQVNFCEFIRDFEIDTIWCQEIMKHYGTAGNIPTDANGNRIIRTTSYKSKIDTVLTSPKRYIIDKMIIENLPNHRIADYCRKQLKIVIYDYDVVQYKEAFFNLKTYNIEENIKTLEVEKASLTSFLEVLEEDVDLELGEKILTRNQTEKRVGEIDENIKTLNMFYSEFAYGQAQCEQTDFAEMFTDVAKKAYARFSQLDRYKDRDIVDPLFKVARIMGYAYEKVSDILIQKADGGKDKHAEFELMKLYRNSAEAEYDQQIKDANKRIEDAGDYAIDDNIEVGYVEGIDELNIRVEDGVDGE